MSELKDWYAVQELAGLPGMAGTVQNVRKWAKKICPQFAQKRDSKGLNTPFHPFPSKPSSIFSTTGESI
jgi:hypothetical protein